MKRMHSQFTDAQAAALERRSSESGRSVAALLREAVDAWMAGDERRARLERARASVGGFHSGLGDLAEHHDEYFVQAIEERIGRR
jgi:hypothetical protein